MLEPIIIAVAIAVVLAIIIIAVIVAKKKDKKAKGKTTDEVVLVDGVRYTKDESIEKADGEVRISHAQGDIVIAQGETKTACKEGPLFPGRYTVLSASEGEPSFNLRVGEFVREYKHGEGIVLGEGDKITAVSHAVILR